MTLLPGYLEPALPMVSTFGPWGLFHPGEPGATSTPSSTTFEAGSRAIYQPIMVPTVCVIRRVWWANGATTTGGATVEGGVYADGGYKPGVKLVSASATQGTASQVQWVDCTDTSIGPGLYWLALVASTATNTTFYRVSPASSTSMDAARRFQESAASPLPATATPVESASANLYVFGFSTTTIT